MKTNVIKYKYKDEVVEKVLELEKISNNVTKEVIINTQSEKGYTAIFNFLGNKSEFYFYFILYIIFEVIALLSLYVSKKQLQNIKPKDAETFKPKEVDETKEQHKLSLIKGGLDVEKVKAYLNYMYNNSKEGISDGYIKISKAVGIKADEGRKIKAWLEGQGILKAEGGKTKIINKINIA